MSHQDDRDLRTSLDNLKAVLDFLVPAAAAQTLRHGNAVIDVATLASVAIACWGWSAKRTLSGRVEQACAAVSHLYSGCDTLSRQGLCQALSTCGEELSSRICRELQRRLRGWKGCWTTAGKPTYAVDGTKFTAPRTAANQQAFAASSVAARKPKRKTYKKASDASKASTVQVLVTLFWHIGSGMPISWRQTASVGSERNEALALLEELPANARIVGDAGYVGYPFWSAVLQSGRSFVVRVGSNVTLLKKLDPQLKRRGDWVHCWPDYARKKGDPPLLLRLIHLQSSRGSLWLLTNELSLTDRQIQEIYRARWGIEVFFRTVKQNCGKAKGLCRTPANVMTELTWTLLGIWASLFVAKLQRQQHHEPLKQLSPMQVMDAFAEALTLTALGLGPIVTLNLQECQNPDERHRRTSKQSRNYPRKKKPKPTGAPTLTTATPKQIAAAKMFH